MKARTEFLRDSNNLKRERFWKDSEENWKSIYRGLDKTGFRPLLIIGIIIPPNDRDYHTQKMESLWKDTDENWKRTYSGLDKTGFNMLIKIGLIVPPKGRDYHTISKFIICYSFLIQAVFFYLGFVTLFKASADLILFVEIAHYYSILAGIHILFIQHYVQKIKMFRQIFETVDGDIFDYRTDFDREEMEKHRLKTVHYMSFVKTGLGSLLGAIAIALNLLPLFRVTKGIQHVQEDIIVTLPVPFWFPFNTKAPLGFALAYFLEFNMITIGILYVGVYISYLVQMMLEIISHLRVLNHSIARIEVRAVAMYNSHEQLSTESPSTSQGISPQDNFYRYCYTDCLKRNIFHHKAILSFINQYQDANSSLFGVVLGMNMFTIAAITIVITKVRFSVDSYKFYLLLIVELVNLFFYCSLGTYITEEAKKIGLNIYNTPWLTTSKTDQKLVKFIQLRVTRDVVLKGNGMISLNLQLYIQILQTSYSIFNLFSSLES